MIGYYIDFKMNVNENSCVCDDNDASEDANVYHGNEDVHTLVLVRYLPF